MTTLYNYPYTSLEGIPGKAIISTGPVIINTTRDKVLLHISETTRKYQFIGGRYDDTLSARENALARAREVVGSENLITLTQDDPLLLMGEIEREGHEQKIVLMHYLAHIADETNVGEAKWFSQEEVTMLDAENKTSSENIKIATDYFLSK